MFFMNRLIDLSKFFNGWQLFHYTGMRAIGKKRL